MLEQIIDNKKRGTLYKYLKDNIKEGAKLAIVSAYFTIYAYEGMKEQLNQIDKLRFLFGEPSFVKNQGGGSIREFSIEKLNRELSVAGTDVELKLKNELNQKSIAKQCANWLREKAEIRSVKNPDFLHGKSYIVENKDGSCFSSVGSSNFTCGGLGIKPRPNIELNIANKEVDTKQQLIEWFEEIWNDDELVEDVKDQVLEYIESMYKDNTPEFIYFFTLYKVFEKSIDELSEEDIVESKIGFKETEVWKRLYNFQRDGVIGAIKKLEKYNGCIIADSVGLGKTFEALAVIKYYELKNNRVLVLTPKKLRENWMIYKSNDIRNILSKDRFNYDILNHTDLTRKGGYSGDINLETINWGNYDLVVIDESHNFRNNQARRDRVTRYSKLMNDIIKSGIKTKVLMLSATPVNNGLKDLKNQIEFITEGKDYALKDLVGLHSIELTLRKAQFEFNKWSKLPDEERTVERLLNTLSYDYFTLLDSLTIARSRKHIEKYYNTNKISKFPKRLPPINKYPKLDIKNTIFDYTTINKKIKKLKLAIYTPLTYVKIDKREEYSRKYDIEVKGGAIFKQTDREKSLQGLIRINLLKRLESSINSFDLTLKKLLNKINDMLNAIENYNYSSYDELDINDIDIEDDELQDLLVGNKIKVLIQDIDKTRWKQDLEYDKKVLEELINLTEKVTEDRDEKLLTLKEVINDKINNPINEGNRKVLIFTAFSDTAKYIYKNLSEWLLKEYKIHSALVVGSDSNETTLDLKNKSLNEILTNFSPISKERNKTGNEIDTEIDVLIATDCISEGQNLQDCDCVINYDIHWNPVRIIQRFGRIDRIGSKNEKIQLINFWPDMELDEYINLERRVSNRMVLLDISATGEENIISGEDLNRMRDLEYRKKQLEKLKNQVIDLEDISGGVSITDFTMNDFRIDLMNYLKENKEKLKRTPTGIHAVVDTIDNKLKEQVERGVIFCLKHINERNEKEDYPLHPYYLVYITDKGEVKYSYTHAKKILDVYRGLCKGKDELLLNLIKLFNEETNDCTDMSKYTRFLGKAINDISGIKEVKGIKSLFSKGGTSIVKDKIKGVEDFELVSFLVIK